jgi:hypothetical protein
VLSITCFSQKGAEIGGWLGTSLYFGDLNTSFQLTEPGYAGGIVGRYNFDERISLKGALSYARIHADDSDSANFFERERGLNFTSQLIDATAHVEFNFFPYVHGHKEFFFTPYLAAGVSVTRFNPKTSRLDPDLAETISITLQPLGTEGQLPGEEYSRVSPGFSIGGGFKFDLSKLWSINIEVATRRLISDYLDDVSGVYADPDTIDGNRGIVFGSGIFPSDIADPTGNFEEGKQRGNSRDNDSYVFIGISVMRYFGTLQCPKPSAIF